METVKLKRLFEASRLSGLFRGLKTIDRLLDFDTNNVTTTSGIYIVYTGTQFESVAHFILILWRDRVLYFFDSYGRNPSQINDLLKKFMKRFPAEIVEFNTVQVQSEQSCICGLWCFYVASKLVDNFSLESIVDSFSPTDWKKNDDIIFAWAKKQIGKQIYLSKTALIQCANIR